MSAKSALSASDLWPRRVPCNYYTLHSRQPLLLLQAAATGNKQTAVALLQAQGKNGTGCC